MDQQSLTSNQQDNPLANIRTLMKSPKSNFNTLLRLICRDEYLSAAQTYLLESRAAPNPNEAVNTHLQTAIGRQIFQNMMSAPTEAKYSEFYKQFSALYNGEMSEIVTNLRDFLQSQNTPLAAAQNKEKIEAFVKKNLEAVGKQIFQNMMSAPTEERYSEFYNQFSALYNGEMSEIVTNLRDFLQRYKSQKTPPAAQNKEKIEAFVKANLEAFGKRIFQNMMNAQTAEQATKFYNQFSALYAGNELIIKTNLRIFLTNKYNSKTSYSPEEWVNVHKICNFLNYSPASKKIDDINTGNSKDKVGEIAKLVSTPEGLWAVWQHSHQARGRPMRQQETSDIMRLEEAVGKQIFQNMMSADTTEKYSEFCNQFSALYNNDMSKIVKNLEQFVALEKPLVGLHQEKIKAFVQKYRQSASSMQQPNQSHGRYSK